MGGDPVNRNKESIALDLKRDDDRIVFDRLVACAGVLVENFTRGTMDRLGYGWLQACLAWSAFRPP